MCLHPQATWEIFCIDPTNKRRSAKLPFHMNRWWTTIIVAMAFCDWYTTWIILVEHKVQHRLSKNTCRTCFQKTNLYSCTADQWSSLLPTPTCPNCKLNIWETISINNDTKPQMDKWNIHTTDRCNAFLRHYARINLRMHVPKAVLELQPPLEHHLLHPPALNLVKLYLLHLSNPDSTALCHGSALIGLLNSDLEKK